MTQPLSARAYAMALGMYQSNPTQVVKPRLEDYAHLDGGLPTAPPVAPAAAPAAPVSADVATILQRMQADSRVKFVEPEQ